MKKLGAIIIIGAIILASFAGCSNQKQEDNVFDSSEAIVAMNRESGSGTKISFLNFLGLEENQIKEEKENVVSGTEVMLSAVENSLYAVGYVSQSSLDTTIKAVSIDDVMPTAENVANGKYPFTRNFTLVTKTEVSELVQDFLDFISANDEIVEELGYLPLDKKGAYSSAKPNGEIKISGSSSVFPLMDKMVEKYKEINPNAEIELSQTDSSHGLESVQNEITDIAMCSRELTEKERLGTKQQMIAKDTIAVIVNANNPIENITLEELKQIYLDEISNWNIK